MPIRVNLKEIFPSDPQEINVEKLNFNFNKLLELGVGSPGPIGLTGPQGPAGPIGLVGPQGDRGATWWVDSGDPNTITFSEPLMDGDMYLDQTSNVFQIWRYDEGTSTWNTVVSIAAIVNSYLSSIASSPFSNGPTGIPASSTKFIIFNNGDQIDPYLDYVNDGTRGAFNTSNNKALVLANFDENVLDSNIPNLIWPANQNSLYNSLFKIVTAHDDAQTSVKADLGRYHLEFGSLYNDGTNILLSDLKHNLKGKFFKRYLTSPELAATNEWINTARFSLSLPEPFIAPDIDQNGEFEFVVPKYNAESSLVREEVFVRIGSAEAFEERTNKAAILADGISITNDQVGRSMVVGLREDLGAVLDLPYSSTNFALFDVSDDVDGLFFNKTLIQTGGNFEQVITTAPIQLDLDTFYTSATTGHFMSQGIWVGSNTIWLASGAGNTTTRTSTGIVQRYDISNPKNPIKHAFQSGPKEIGLAPVGVRLDQHGHNTQGTINIGLIKDVAEYGKYIVTIHHRGATVSGDKNDLLILETDSYINGAEQIGQIEDSSLEDAYRVQVHGKYAWVITNRTYSTGPQIEGGSLVKAKLTSVDISNPNAPAIADSFEEYYDTLLPGSVGEGTKYLDFDIKDGKAFVLRYTNYVATSPPPASTHTLDLLVFDVQDPTNFSSLTTYIDNTITPPVTTPYTPQNRLNLETLTVNTTRTEFGGIDTQDQLVYVVWEDSLYISELTDLTMLLRSTTSLSAESMNACDIAVRGKYAYILINYANSTGSVQVWDISNKTSPFMVSEIRNANLANSSRLSISGKYIYVVSNTGTNAELITLDITGIDSPSAQIGAIKTNDLQVSGNAHVKNNLQVKNSLNVGPGGIYIDRGIGLTSDGTIASIISTDGNDRISGGIGTLMINTRQSASTAANFTQFSSAIVNPSVYDAVYGRFNILLGSSTGSSTYRLRNGYIDNQILRAGQTYRYGEDLIPGSNAFVGNQILLGIAGTDRLYGNFIGSDIWLGPNAQLQSNDTYGYKFNFQGSSSGTVYGLHIQGADENLIEGNLQAVDSIQVGTSSKIKNEWHGWVSFTYNVGLSGNASITSTDDYTSGLNLEGITVSATSRQCTTGLTHAGYGDPSENLLYGNLKLSVPTLSNMNKATIQVTPRYAGTQESTLMSYIGQVNTTSDINIYWRSIIPATTLASIGTLAFYISIYEYN